jgi:membrane protease YdiL (CAAX protease family)
MIDPHFVRTAIIAAIGALLAGSLLTWVAVLGRLRDGRDVLAWSPRRPVPWGLLDVGAAILLLIVVEGAALQLSGVDPKADLTALPPVSQARAFWGMFAGRIAASGLILLVLVVRVQARGADWGVQLRQVTTDLKLGCLAFLFVAPLIYVLQTLLISVWAPSAHPLVVSVQKNPGIGLFAAACATAVVSAPIVEEFLLRVVLQGWLEKVAVWRGDTTELLVGGTVDDDHGSGDWPPQQRRRKPAAREQFEYRPPPWPIFISALVFALMHLQKEPSPDPITLFFFALALGYVYQRTHRLLPCVVMHVLLNAASMTMLGLSVFCPEGVPSWLPL